MMAMLRRLGRCLDASACSQASRVSATGINRQSYSSLCAHSAAQPIVGSYSSPLLLNNSIVRLTSLRRKCFSQLVYRQSTYNSHFCGNRNFRTSETWNRQKKPLTMAPLVLSSPKNIGPSDVQLSKQLIYCNGSLLDAVQQSKMFNDCKHFVDMPLKRDPCKCYKKFLISGKNIHSARKKKSGNVFCLFYSLF